MLTGQKILLRTLEDCDLDFLFDLENNYDTSYLHENLSDYSKSLLKEYIKNAKQDIFISGQFRFLIEHNCKSVGLIDLFDFNIDEMSFHIGIIIINKYRKKGYATEALELLVDYAWKNLILDKLCCTISNNNNFSIRLFTNAGFVYKKSIEDGVNLYILKR